MNMQHFIRVTEIAKAQPAEGAEPVNLSGDILVCVEDITMVEPLYDIKPHPLMNPDKPWQVTAIGTMLSVGEGRVVLSDSFEVVADKIHAALTGAFMGVEGQQPRHLAKPHGDVVVQHDDVPAELGSAKEGADRAIAATETLREAAVTNNAIREHPKYEDLMMTVSVSKRANLAHSIADDLGLPRGDNGVARVLRLADRDHTGQG
jgi:hypothetical protein